jgi:primosomal protein N' (replication factor Y) (superfamily II helicase)
MRVSPRSEPPQLESGTDPSQPACALAHGAVLRVVPVPALGRVTALDYLPPPSCVAIEPGTRVLIPVGSRRCMGVVSEILARSEAPGRLKEVVTVLEDAPVFDEPLFRLVRWMAEYYLAPLGEAIGTALPGPLRIETERLAELVAPGPDTAPPDGLAAEIVSALHNDGAIELTVLRQRFGAAAAAVVARMRRKGLVRLVERVRRETAPIRHAVSYEARNREDAPSLLARRPALQKLYAYLCAHPLRRASAAELRASFPSAAAKLRDLVAAGLVHTRQEEIYRSVLPPLSGPDHPVTLNAAQRTAVEAVERSRTTGFRTFLLHGVTGSGKTEVYLHAIAGARQRQRTALVLVPEISLTHQLVDRVRARFGEQVAVLHSQLSTGERWDEWRRIARGEAAIVIGARSAIFAPLRDVGVIVVDEEHDAAYKQADGVHYNGRDVAVMRAKLSDCPVLLGSATPSMESFHNARTGRYRLLELPERVASRPLPSVELVDLRHPERTVTPVLSPRTAAAIEANLTAAGQSLIFLNRRGFANFLQCRACGEPLMCPNCSVTLTWHRRWRALRCHYCGHTVPPPERCPECGEPALESWGTGTEQVETRLREAYPNARIARMDRDTTRRKGSQARLLSEWANGKLDILVGTQMIAKGHDIPGVTLVVVLLADLSLNFPDFRAAEQTFQLLAQVAGRAGRGERAGRVIVETLQPMHYSLQAAARHDFAAFATQELAARQELDYPPFARLLLLRFEGERQIAVDDLAAQVARRLRDLAASAFTVLGPAPAPLERLRGRYRRQILLRGRNGSALRRAAREIIAAFYGSARKHSIRLIVDVDPYNML